MTVASTLPPVNGTVPRAAQGATVPPSGQPTRDGGGVPVEKTSDQYLVAQVREGDRAAFGELWSRHEGAARAIAWRYVGIADPDDALQEASRVMLAAILRGGGPFGDFRPYLAVAIRNAAISLGRRRTPEPVGDANELSDFVSPSTPDSTSTVLEGMVMARAFKRLPARWQEVLWYVCVEDLSMAAAGAILGLSSNATAALAKRARDGLRLAWLEAHLNDERFGTTCRELAPNYPAHIQGSLTPERAEQVADHLADCDSCPELIIEIRNSVGR